MRFILNQFPDDRNFNPDEKWTPLKESDNLFIVLIQSIPFMITNVALMILLMNLIGISFQFDPKTMFLSFLIFVPIHELIHALFFPENLSSKKVYFGFTFKGFAPFAAYTGEMKRNTFLKVLMAPLIIISVMGFLYLLLFGTNNMIEHIIVFNALGSCADCLGALLLIWQTPKDAIIRNKKMKTYWKIMD